MRLKLKLIGTLSGNIELKTEAISMHDDAEKLLVTIFITHINSALLAQSLGLNNFTNSGGRLSDGVAVVRRN